MNERILIGEVIAVVGDEINISGVDVKKAILWEKENLITRTAQGLKGRGNVDLNNYDSCLELAKLLVKSLLGEVAIRVRNGDGFKKIKKEF